MFEITLFEIILLVLATVFVVICGLNLGLSYKKSSSHIAAENTAAAAWIATLRREEYDHVRKLDWDKSLPPSLVVRARKAQLLNDIFYQEIALEERKKEKTKENKIWERIDTITGDMEKQVRSQTSCKCDPPPVPGRKTSSETGRITCSVSEPEDKTIPPAATHFCQPATPGPMFNGFTYEAQTPEEIDKQRVRDAERAFGPHKDQKK